MSRSGSFAFLVITFLLSIWIRFLWPPIVDGGILRSVDPDSTRFLRQAKIIAKEGKLPARDMMRWLPEGRDMRRQLSLSSYMIYAIWRISNILGFRIPIEIAATYYPLICFIIAMMVFYLLVSSLFGRYVALLSTNILSVFPSLVSRSHSGMADRDSFVFLLGMTSFLLFLKSMNGTRRRRLILSLISGLSMMITGLSWEGVGLFSSVIVFFFLFLFVISKLDQLDLLCYTLWLIPYGIGIMAFTRTYHDLRVPFAFLAVIVPILIWIVFIISFLSTRWGDLQI